MATSATSAALPRCLRSEEGLAGSQPLDISDLAARLETEGVTNSVASREFGFESTLAMATSWFPRVVTYGPPLEASAPAKSFLREFAEGVAFALPLLCSWIATAWLGFALWGGRLPDEEATAAGLGMVCSFLLAGGPVQAMVRRGLFFYTTRQRSLCSAALLQGAVLGLAFLVGGSGVLIASSVYWSWLPLKVNLLGAAYAIALGAFWIAAGALYVIGKSIHLAWLNGLGIACVWTLHQPLRMQLPAAQLISILACTAISSVLVARDFRNDSVKLAWKMDADWLALIPFCAYGFLYYAILFSDRLLAWTAGTFSDSLAVQFRGDYETAVNLGMPLFVVLAGWVHFATAQFYTITEQAERDFRVEQRSQFQRRVWSHYVSMTLRLAALGAIVVALTLGFADMLNLLPSANSWQIAGWSLAGFTLLAFSLWNVNLLIALCSAEKVVVCAIASWIVNLAVAYLGSRIGGYSYAVIGFVAGATTLGVLTAFQLKASFRKLEYHYFLAGA